MKSWAIIVAGGSGKRMGSHTPKQLLKLGVETILEWTLKPFIRSSVIDGIVIVAVPEIREFIDGINGGLTDKKEIIITRNGQERQDSVRNGIAKLPEDTDIVIIHDAVRPFITEALIADCLKGADEKGAVSVMRPVKETVKIVEADRIVKTLDRSTVWITQTPQAFRKSLIQEAHESAQREGFIGTDDCMLVEHLGRPVYCIEGSDMNIKITTPADLKIAGEILKIFENEEKKC